MIKSGLLFVHERVLETYNAMLMSPSTNTAAHTEATAALHDAIEALKNMPTNPEVKK